MVLTNNMSAVVDPFRKDSMPERQLDVKAGIDHTVEKILETYHDQAAEHPGQPVSHYVALLRDYVLTPGQLGVCVPLLLKKGDYDEPTYPAAFISALLQCSYDSGHNGFNLPLNREIINLAYDVYGRREDPILITAFGSVGSAFAFDAKYLHATIHGDSNDELGLGSYCCRFNVSGDLGFSGGCGARQSTFTFRNAAGNLGNGAKDCDFYIRGHIGHITNMPGEIDLIERCTYHCALQETLEYLRDNWWVRKGTCEAVPWQPER
jgi:hypothetical protein